MIEIKDLLVKFNNLLLSEETQKKTIGSVLLKTIGVNIEIKDIKIQNSTIYLNIKPIYKNEIFFKKNEIFYELKKSLGNKTPEDIR
jgi:hypothetical protein